MAILEDAVEGQTVSQTMSLVSMLSGWVQQNSRRSCCYRDATGLSPDGLLAAVLLL